jgi:alpha-beta hydrolase superfamily lysophospholipase
MTDLKPSRLQMFIIRLLSRLLPRSGALELDPAGVSRDPGEVARYVQDPLVNHGKMTARMVAELMAAMDSMQLRAHEIRLPLLLLHGGADSMTSPEGSRFLEHSVSSTDKTLRIYPGLYHEIFNEPEREAVMRDVEEWCDRLLAA